MTIIVREILAFRRKALTLHNPVSHRMSRYFQCKCLTHPHLAPSFLWGEEAVTRRPEGWPSGLYIYIFPNQMDIIQNTPFILQTQSYILLYSSSFKFQPYSKGQSLTWKNPFCSYYNLFIILTLSFTLLIYSPAYSADTALYKALVYISGMNLVIYPY